MVSKNAEEVSVLRLDTSGEFLRIYHRYNTIRGFLNHFNFEKNKPETKTVPSLFCYRVNSSFHRACRHLRWSRTLRAFCLWFRNREQLVPTLNNVVRNDVISTLLLVR